MKFAQCSRLLGCAMHTAEEVYLELSKRYDHIILVQSIDFEYSDIIIVDTVEFLMRIRRNICDGMTVVVCDSAINLLSLKNMRGLDFEGIPLSNKFVEKDYGSLAKYPIEITSIEKIADYDPLDLAVKSIIKVTILVDYNNISAHLNRPAREHFNKLIIETLLTPHKVSDIHEYIKSITKDRYTAETFTSKKFEDIRRAIIDRKRGHTMHFVTSMYHVDSYEVSFMEKLLRKANVSIPF